MCVNLTKTHPKLRTFRVLEAVKNVFSIDVEHVFSIGVYYGTSVFTLCFLSHLRVHYCYVVPVKYA